MVEQSPIQKIEKSLISNTKGMTIHQIMTKTKLARGTVKSYLDELIRMGRVHEEEYGLTTKVYFLNGVGEFQQKVQMFKDGVLFVDVMTDPWMRPFVRVKLKNKKDVGAIFLNSEESIDKLINILNNSKPQLRKYREMVKKVEVNQKAA